MFSSTSMHVALILDGNRTWATSKGLPKFEGHTKGAENLHRILEAAMKQGIDFVTLYTLSTENLKRRSADELRHLFSLFEKLKDHINRINEHDVKVRYIGDLSKLPDYVQKSLRAVQEATANNSGMTATFAVNYGGRDELVRATNKAIEAGTPVTEEAFPGFLDTAGLPDVDLVIRTGGYKRLSNYLLWQAAYAELYFTDTKWPAFSPEELETALVWFKNQQRNRGR